MMVLWDDYMVIRVGTPGTAARDDIVFFCLTVVHEYARSWTPSEIQGFHARIKKVSSSSMLQVQIILEREHQLSVVLLYTGIIEIF